MWESIQSTYVDTRMKVSGAPRAQGITPPTTTAMTPSLPINGDPESPKQVPNPRGDKVQICPG